MMNNRGFAITTILFGLLLLFILLIISLLGLLSIWHNNLEKIIDSNNGSRNIVTILKNDTYANYGDLINSGINKSGLYCFKDTNECHYLGRNLLVEDSK